jgi:exodeoxyribonuclease V alpha subunit
LGLPTDHPSRIEAGIVFALNEMIEDGHVYAPQELLLQRATELLEVPKDLLPPALDRLAQEDRIRPDLIPLNSRKDGKEKLAVAESQAMYGTPAIYLTPLYFGEKGVAERVKSLAGSSSLSTTMNHSLFPAEELSAEQQAAIDMALTHPVSILTGGPGTGKTTCLKALIDTLEAHHKRYALASPTGRAAKRLSEATRKPARTIHRLLEYSPLEGFKHNENNPLDLDFLVVDEASMLDLLLTNHLLKAVRTGTHVLFVGDVDQLPSVGAGDVLRDLIQSGIAPVTRLNTIFRQAANSKIITNAHLINQGRFPVFSQGEGDFFLFPAEDAPGAADWVIQIVTERIPQKFGLDAVQDIQVLSPIYRGSAGVNDLNDRLQEKLNPPSNNKPERRLFGTVFRLGDKVMQTRNNYDKDVYNGDIGFIESIDMIEQSLTMNLDGRSISFDWSEADQLTLAYVVSVHKAQGSEFPAVVMPVVTQHYTMLQRNLLYTAITRARNLCVLAGSRKAIGIAVRNNKVANRFTALEWRLEKKIEERGF